MRSWLRLLPLALSVAACARPDAPAKVSQEPAAASAGYSPNWHVGDWWVVKTERKAPSGEWKWSSTRYEVTGIEKVHGRDCFAVKVQSQDRVALSEGDKDLYWVRADSWFVAMKVMTFMYQGRLHSDTLDSPQGMFGPSLGGDQWLPRFPLRMGNDADTMFRCELRDFGRPYLRDVSEVADTQIVRRLLADGDDPGGRALRPTGIVYQVRKELTGSSDSRPMPDDQSLAQSLQLWCADQPWRIYEESSWGPGNRRHVTSRSWLVAVGHKKK